MLWRRKPTCCMHQIRQISLVREGTSCGFSEQGSLQFSKALSEKQKLTHSMWHKLLWETKGVIKHDSNNVIPIPQNSGQWWTFFRNGQQNIKWNVIKRSVYEENYRKLLYLENMNEVSSKISRFIFHLLKNEVLRQLMDSVLWSFSKVIFRGKLRPFFKSFVGSYLEKMWVETSWREVDTRSFTWPEAIL